MANRPTCALLVLNYNGRTLLEECLASVVDAAQKSKLCTVQTIIVDNQSQDGSREWAQSHFSQVSVLLSPENAYLYSLNWAARLVDTEYLLLLNNDVILEPHSLDPLFEPLLSNGQVFSVTPLLLRPDRQSLDAGKRWGEFRRGFLHHDTDPGVSSLAPTLFPTGGAFTVSRDRFLALGGFDRLFYPAYWEDIDLGYRAWKCGYANLFQPESVMYHMGSASWKRESQEQVRTINLRNTWLFTWRNVVDPGILGANLVWTARYFAGSFRRKDRILRKAYRDAFARWSQAVTNRNLSNCPTKLSDREICGFANSDGETLFRD
jgi:GT2 family glycosyltransferase